MRAVTPLRDPPVTPRDTHPRLKRGSKVISSAEGGCPAEPSEGRVCVGGIVPVDESGSEVQISGSSEGAWVRCRVVLVGVGAEQRDFRGGRCATRAPYEARRWLGFGWRGYRRPRALCLRIECRGANASPSSPRCAKGGAPSSIIWQAAARAARMKSCGIPPLWIASGRVRRDVTHRVRCAFGVSPPVGCACGAPRPSRSIP